MLNSEAIASADRESRFPTWPRLRAGQVPPIAVAIVEDRMSGAAK
jgi:hypothetical protein